MIWPGNLPVLPVYSLHHMARRRRGWGGLQRDLRQLSFNFSVLLRLTCFISAHRSHSPYWHVQTNPAPNDIVVATCGRCRRALCTISRLFASLSIHEGQPTIAGASLSTYAGCATTACRDPHVHPVSKCIKSEMNINVLLALLPFSLML